EKTVLPLCARTEETTDVMGCLTDPSDFGGSVTSRPSRVVGNRMGASAQMRFRARGEGMVRRSLALTCSVLLAGLLSGPASASSSVASDATGDIATSAPAYLDIIHTKATEQIGRGTFFFQTVNADQVPATPAGFAAWNWLIDVPGGLPIDYALTVRFCSQTVQRTCGPGPWHWESSSTPMATGVST